MMMNSLITTIIGLPYMLKNSMVADPILNERNKLQNAKEQLPFHRFFLFIKSVNDIFPNFCK